MLLFLTIAHLIIYILGFFFSLFSKSSLVIQSAPNQWALSYLNRLTLWISFLTILFCFYRDFFGTHWLYFVHPLHFSFNTMIVPTTFKKKSHLLFLLLSSSWVISYLSNFGKQTGNNSILSSTYFLFFYQSSTYFQFI